MLAPLTRLAPLAVVVCLTASGCAGWNGPSGPPLWAPVPGPNPVRSVVPEAARTRPVVVPVAYREPLADDHGPPASATRHPLEGLTTLTPDDVVRVALERNPTLDQMRATAAAVAARYPQVTSLDDPNFAFTTAPGSAGATHANYAARVEVSQKLLYPGKRGLKGDAVRAETAAAGADVDATRLELAEAAVSALADYYLAEKVREVVAENLDLLRQFHKTAADRYKVGQGPQQDMLQAEVEIARQEERLVGLRRAKAVAAARLNTLMHLLPDASLPPPADVRTAFQMPDVVALRDRAVATRPDVQAVVARVNAEETALALAQKEYNPDVEVMAAYDGFWQGPGGPPLQWQIGARVNLPVRYARRGGAVEEARAKVAQRRAELVRLVDRVNFEVQEAVEQFRESTEVVRLYEEKTLKAADANVKEAQAGYAVTKVPFLNLVEAQRNRTMLKDRYYEALAETARRRAALERVIGGSDPLTPPVGSGGISGCCRRPRAPLRPRSRWRRSCRRSGPSPMPPS
jgi:outer membrane protein, heavy metal efflux system